MSARTNTFELVLIEIANATDALGKRVTLLHHAPNQLPNAADFRRSIAQMTHGLGAVAFLDGLGSPPVAGVVAEKAYAKNLELLTRGWIECLAYEEAKRDRVS